MVLWLFVDVVLGIFAYDMWHVTEIQHSGVWGSLGYLARSYLKKQKQNETSYCNRYFGPPLAKKNTDFSLILQG